MEVLVRVLGPLEVRADDRSVAIRRGKPAALFAVLLLAREQVVSSEELIEALWPADPPQRAAKAIHTYASELRRVLPDGVLFTQPPGYVLRPGAVDIAQFEALADRGMAQRRSGNASGAHGTLEQGLALWRGPALADFRYEPFAQAESQRLEELRLRVLEERIEADLTLGRDGDILGELLALVNAHPLRDRFRMQLMLALYRTGRQAEALETYTDARRRFVDELGLEPSVELQQLQHAILNQDPDLAAPSPAPVNLPAERPPKRRVLTRLSLSAALTLATATAAITVLVANPEQPSQRGRSAAAVRPSEQSRPDARLPFPSVPRRYHSRYAVVPWPNRRHEARLLMRIRPRTDPVCSDLLGGDKTCFTIRPRANPADPGARGEAAFNRPFIALRYIRIPFEPWCEGEIDRYKPDATGRDVRLVRPIVQAKDGPVWTCAFWRFQRLGGS